MSDAREMQYGARLCNKPRECYCLRTIGCAGSTVSNETKMRFVFGDHHLKRIAAGRPRCSTFPPCSRWCRPGLCLHEQRVAMSPSWHTSWQHLPPRSHFCIYPRAMALQGHGHVEIPSCRQELRRIKPASPGEASIISMSTRRCLRGHSKRTEVAAERRAQVGVGVDEQAAVVDAHARHEGQPIGARVGVAQGQTILARRRAVCPDEEVRRM